MDLLFLLGRVLFGGYFLYKGIGHFTQSAVLVARASNRHVPSPKIAVYATGILILLGGAGVILGISPVWSLVCLIVFLIPVTFIMHQFWKETDPLQRRIQVSNFLRNIALLGAVLMLLSFPTPWPLSF
ncbi:MAG: DoxX family protein [Candidatus Pacebacteria bacterium]|nr:DoxX family protein [Candidatus Paceibacterota bacterium]MDD5357219.1 DoxX family protein [Candidatus Paceibacterota bacterium]